MINHYHFARGGCDENVRTMGFPVLIVNIEAAVPSVPQKQKETTLTTTILRQPAIGGRTCTTSASLQNCTRIMAVTASFLCGSRSRRVASAPWKPPGS